MDCCAVLSFLGFPSWGPLHLLIPNRGNPHSLAQRLLEASRLSPRQDQARAGWPSSALLPAFMRSQKDLEPLLEAPGAGQAWCPGRQRYRYRIVCRHGDADPLSISFWYEAEAAPPKGPHRSERMSLSQFMERFDPGKELLTAPM
jgi:hypothetical protein